jgi:GT2 family glycosyltransferase
MPELSITIVNWNGRGFLPACLKSIVENPPSIAFEVIVVDNASTDGSAEWLTSADAKSIFPDKNLRTIINADNVGFGRGHNVAINNSTTDYVLVLNPDCIVRQDAINQMLRSLKSDSRIGAVAPKLFNEDGSPQASVTLFPLNPLTIVALALKLPRFMPKRLRERFYGEYWAHDEERAVPSFWGAAILAKRETINDVGAFDEDFFMYGEDHEWCARMNQNGWKTVYVPDAEIIHLGGKSAAQIWDIAEKEIRMWSGDILAHKKSVRPTLAAANALTRAAFYSIGFLKYLLLRRSVQLHSKRVRLLVNAAKTSLTGRS